MWCFPSLSNQKWPPTSEFTSKYSKCCIFNFLRCLHFLILSITLDQNLNTQIIGHLSKKIQLF